MILNEYLARLPMFKKSNETIDSYTRLLTRMRDFIKENYGKEFTKEDVNNITAVMLLEFYNSFGDIKDTSKNTYVAVIKAFYSYMSKMGYIRDDYSKALEMIPIDKGDPIDMFEDTKEYSIDEIYRMMNADIKRNGLRNKAIIALFLGTGLRASELASLNIGDYMDSKDQMLYVKRKGGIMRHVPMADFSFPAVNAYLEWRGETDKSKPLFVSERGNRMNRNSIYNAIRYIQEKVGVKTGLHNFRHTVLSSIAKTTSRDIAQTVASHSDKKTTGIYIHETKKDMLDAINNIPWGKQKNKDGEENYSYE